MLAVKKAVGGLLRLGPVPKHVGIIMDGNRRYAKNHKIELKEGHNLGFELMAQILELMYECGVQCATVYAFSIENFKRSLYEVAWLMELAKNKLLQIVENGQLCKKYGVKVRIIGNTLLLREDVREVLNRAEDITKDNTRAILNVCFPYTSRDEMATLIKRTVEQSLESHEPIDEHTITNNLYTSECPPLELLIRTLGTYRLLDFLLWQCVLPDCAVVFVDKLWPEFSPWDLVKILLQWSFNKYWYGHGNGEVAPHTREEIASLKDSSQTALE